MKTHLLHTLTALVFTAAVHAGEQVMERNQPAAGNGKPDRQAAYGHGARYIQLTSRFKNKLTKEELELWEGVEKLVNTYAASPEIKAAAGKRGK